MLHRYLPTGELDEKKMLEVIGAGSRAELFNSAASPRWYAAEGVAV